MEYRDTPSAVPRVLFCRVYRVPRTFDYPPSISPPRFRLFVAIVVIHLLGGYAGAGGGGGGLGDVRLELPGKVQTRGGKHVIVLSLVLT